MLFFAIENGDFLKFLDHFSLRICSYKAFYGIFEYQYFPVHLLHICFLSSFSVKIICLVDNVSLFNRTS